MNLDFSYLYLLLNGLTLSYPLARSFEHRVQYHTKWKAIFPGIFAAGALFIAWDVWFTDAGYWGFNDRYLTGIQIGNLPLEEWLFFLTVPYSCIFIYECIHYFFPKDVFGKAKMAIGLALLGLSVVLCMTAYDRWYPLCTFALLGALMIYHLFIAKTPYLGRFFLAWLFCMIPFFLVNGVLTGTGIEEQVVWYNDGENLGIRIGTIPFEDNFYGMSLILLAITIMEARLKRW